MGNFKIHLFSKIIYTLVYLSEIKKQLWDKKASNFACVASFYVCGSSSRNCLKQGHPVNYRNYSSSPFNEAFVTTSLELHQVKAAKHLHHTFQITDTFLQSNANAKDKFHVKCFDQLRKQIVFRWVFVCFFLRNKGKFKNLWRGVRWGKKETQQCVLNGLVHRQQKAPKFKSPVGQINARSQIYLENTPKEHLI